MKKVLIVIVFSVFLLFGYVYGSNISSDVYVFLKIREALKERNEYRDTMMKNFSFSVVGGREYVDLIVEVEGDLGELRDYVVKKFVGRRNFYILRVPVDRVVDIVNVGTVKYATLSKKIKPFMDRVREVLNLQYIYNYYGYDTVQGKDVIVGVIDSGLDIFNEDFKLSSGISKVLYLWDQTVDSVNSQLGFGVEYDRNQISSGNYPIYDEIGHGTHVAGIVSGMGRLSLGKYSGIATGADLVVVKTDFSTGGILSGIEYVLSKAKKFGKPCVVNLSLGNVIGSHDGKDIESEIVRSMLDEYGRKGNVIVVAGGNSGSFNQHYSNTISSLTRNIIFKVSNLSSGIGYVITDFWIPGGTIFEYRITTPSGYTLGWNLVSSLTSPITNSTNFSDGSVLVVATSNRYNSDINLQIVVLGSVKDGNWTVSLRTTGQTVLVHSWIDFSENIFSYFVNGDNSYTLNSFIPIDDVIVVSAYTTKNMFTSRIGQVVFSQLTNDNISFFSSRGPTRDGRQKPDISAPGAVILAPMSSKAMYSLSEIDATYTNYVGEMGTSMSAPVVSGIVALLLGINPEFTTRDILDYLKTYSEVSIYDANGKDWDEAWGWGKVYIKPIVESLKEPQTLVWFSGNVIRLDANQKSTTLNFRLTEGNDTVEISIYDLKGNLLKNIGKFYLYQGLNSVEIKVDDWFRTGVYYVKVFGSRFNTTLKLVVLK